MHAAGMAEEQIRAVLLRLVRLGEGTEDTRQRVSVSGLASDDRRMLDILAAADLVTIDGDSAELAKLGSDGYGRCAAPQPRPGDPAPS